MTQLMAPATEELESYRGELRGYCYRMLGSAFDADDAVQETLVKAWQGLDRFEGRSSVRSWLYRIATNACLDALRSRGRRALPMDLAGPGSAASPVGAPLPESVWVEPCPDAELPGPTGDPAASAVHRDSVRLAFVAALQHLPPRQRAVLILREVLCWQAAEVAELLDSSVASVNSALQRARATLAQRGPRDDDPSGPLTDDDRALVGRYVEAFETYDIASLVTLLHEDAGFSMPPLPLWLQGRADVHDFYLGTGSACRGSKLVPTSANGCPAFGHYKPAEDGDGYVPWALQVLELSGGRLVHLHHFLDTERLFPRFGLPDRLQ
ncbi:MAG: sigma-70 family RNA polymerase sigma factor [Frankiaceae bacterium]|nr:sigma-70 family RNA polymerase sigma factor [Frankiaceae bacterium]